MIGDAKATALPPSREAHVCCLSCGQTTKRDVPIVPDGLGFDLGLEATAPCPKCGATAYVKNIRGLWAFMEAAAKDLAQIKRDILQDEGDGR